MACIACARRRAKVIALPLHTAGVSLERIMAILHFVTEETYYTVDENLFMVPNQRII